MLVQEQNNSDKSGNRAERVVSKNRSPVAMFEKVLRAFENGDLSFSDLLSSLTRLLKDGAPPTELLRVLQRRELIDPLPDGARDKIISVLQEATPVDVAEENVDNEAQMPAAAGEIPDTMPNPSLEEEPDNSAMSKLIKDFVAAWDTEPKLLPAQFIPAPETSGLNVDYKAMRLALGQREDDLAALQAEHSRVLGLLETRARSGAQLQNDLHDLAAKLAASRDALQSQQAKTLEIEQVLAERIAAEEAAKARSERARDEEVTKRSELHRLELGALRESLAARNADIEDMNRAVAERDATLEHMSRSLATHDGVINQARRLLAERDAQIVALRAEHAQLAPKLESGAQAAAADRDAWADKVLTLQRLLEQRDSALDERHAALEAQKQQHSKIVAAFMTRVKATDDELKAALGRIEGLASELQSRDQARASAARAAAAPGGVETLGTALVSTEPASTEPASAEPVSPEIASTAPVSTAPVSTAPRFELRRGVEIEEFSVPPPPAQPGIWKPGSIVRTAGIGAAIVVLAIVAWVARHHAPAVAKAPEVAATPVPAPGTVIRDCPTCPAFTVLPAGRFKQGSADSNASSAVRPLHWVAIAQPFAISTNAVTVDQFRAFAAATGRDMQGCDTYDGRWKHQAKYSWQNPGFEQGGSHPVTCVSWSDAKAYAQWLSQLTGHRYRLPSASEWEYAARAGSEAAQPWGGAGSDACANANVADLSAAHRYPGWVAFACNDGYVFTAPVGSFKSSAFGLNDMLGNVFQWTEDCWNANYKGAPIDGSVRADGNCAEHELRGGSWFSSPGYVRVDYRNHFAADYRTSSAGIRLVRGITP